MNDYVFYVVPSSRFLPSVDSPDAKGELLLKRHQVEEFQGYYPEGHVRELLPIEKARLEDSRAHR